MTGKKFLCLRSGGGTSTRSPPASYPPDRCQLSDGPQTGSLVPIRDRHIMLFLEPIMLCSSSQFCFHYAHATIPIMPALCSNLKDSAHVFRNLHLFWVYGLWYKSKLSFHWIFVVLSDLYRIIIYQEQYQ